MDETILKGVHPTLVAAISKVLAAMAALGYPMRVCQGARTAEEQHKLYQQGRTTPGPGATTARPLGDVVTNADGYAKLSNHQIYKDGYGKAVDCCFLGPTPFPEDPLKWGAYGACVKLVGLKWGGDWKSTLIDRPHAEVVSVA